MSAAIILMEAAGDAVRLGADPAIFEGSIRIIGERSANALSPGSYLILKNLEWEGGRTSEVIASELRFFARATWLSKEERLREVNQRVAELAPHFKSPEDAALPPLPKPPNLFSRLKAEIRAARSSAHPPKRTTEELLEKSGVTVHGLSKPHADALVQPLLDSRMQRPGAFNETPSRAPRMLFETTREPLGQELLFSYSGYNHYDPASHTFRRVGHSPIRLPLGVPTDVPGDVRMRLSLFTIGTDLQPLPLPELQDLKWLVRPEFGSALVLHDLSGRIFFIPDGTGAAKFELISSEPIQGASEPLFRSMFGGKPGGMLPNNSIEGVTLSPDLASFIARTRASSLTTGERMELLKQFIERNFLFASGPAAQRMIMGRPERLMIEKIDGARLGNCLDCNAIGFVAAVLMGIRVELKDGFRVQTTQSGHCVTVSNPAAIGEKILQRDLKTRYETAFSGAVTGTDGHAYLAYFDPERGEPRIIDMTPSRIAREDSLEPKGILSAFRRREAPVDPLLGSPLYREIERLCDHFGSIYDGMVPGPEGTFSQTRQVALMRSRVLGDAARKSAAESRPFAERLTAACAVSDALLGRLEVSIHEALTTLPHRKRAELAESLRTLPGFEAMKSEPHIELAPIPRGKMAYMSLPGMRTKRIAGFDRTADIEEIAKRLAPFVLRAVVDPIKGEELLEEAAAAVSTRIKPAEQRIREFVADAAAGGSASATSFFDAALGTQRSPERGLKISPEELASRLAAGGRLIEIDPREAAALRKELKISEQEALRLLASASIRSATTGEPVLEAALHIATEG